MLQSFKPHQGLKLNIVDFTDINVYPRKYWVNYKNGKQLFVIRSIMIEDIEMQQKTLAAKQTQIVIGDSVLVDFIFGHNQGKNGQDDWVDVHIAGQFKVLGFIPHCDTTEIELVVKQI